MNQRIDGNGNIQIGRVAGDLRIEPQPYLDPNNPNIAPCPCCGNLASRIAPLCPVCSYPILDVFINNEKIERKKSLYSKATVVIVILFALGILMSRPWFPASWLGPAGLVEFVIGFLALALAKAADGIR